MAKYLTLFDTYSSYEEYIEGPNAILPNVSYCKDNAETYINPVHDYSQDYLTFNIISAGTIVWKAQNTAYTTTIEYSTDNGETWTSITSNTGASAPSISVNAGDVVQFRGDNATYSSGSSRYNVFSGTTCQFNACGNIMSLVNSTGYASAITLVNVNIFERLFSYCTGLTSAENLILPATALTNSCYSSMFSYCRSLTTAPELPATTLTSNCYSSMFSYCRSLTTAPELPATTLASNCYSQMFSNCTSLTTAPELPATTLADNCYTNMFMSCTSLTTTPELPATTLAYSCYWGMFASCTSLTTAPELPVTTLALSCYQNMFAACTNLTTAPELPATTLTSNCYRQMFMSCSNLNYIKCLATDISESDCTYRWIQGVASTGTFVKPSTTDWSSKTGTNGIPANWTVQDAS